MGRREGHGQNVVLAIVMPHHFQHQKLQLVSQYLKSFHALIFHALHHCVSGITILCMTQFSLNKHCFTCSSSLCNCRMRVYPNPKLVQQVLGERTGFEETIPASARVCAPCYKAHLLIIKEGPKSIDQDRIQLITDLKRGIPSSDTIKIKDDIVNKALHILAIYVGEKLLHEESLLLPAVHKTFSSIASDVACTTRGGVEGPAGTANAVPLFTVVRIAVPLFKAGRTSAANVPPRMRDCSARAYSTYAWASTVKLILTKATV